MPSQIFINARTRLPPECVKRLRLLTGSFPRGPCASCFPRSSAFWPKNSMPRASSRTSHFLPSRAATNRRENFCAGSKRSEFISRSAMSVSRRSSQRRFSCGLDQATRSRNCAMSWGRARNRARNLCRVKLRLCFMKEHPYTRLCPIRI